MTTILLVVTVATTTSTEPTQIEVKSPIKAVLLEAFIPGGGSFYLHNYRKGVLIGGIKLALGGASLYYYLEYRNLKSQGLYYLDAESTFYDCFWWFTLVWLFSLTDAYVSANFWRFEEQTHIGIQISYRF